MAVHRSASRLTGEEKDAVAARDGNGIISHEHHTVDVRGVAGEESRAILVESSRYESGERGGEGDCEIGRTCRGWKSEANLADSGHGSGVSEQLDSDGNAIWGLGVHG